MSDNIWIVQRTAVFDHEILGVYTECTKAEKAAIDAISKEKDDHHHIVVKTTTTDTSVKDMRIVHTYIREDEWEGAFFNAETHPKFDRHKTGKFHITVKDE